MSAGVSIPNAFFTANLPCEEAAHVLDQILEGPSSRSALFEELVAVARRTHPGSVGMIANAQSKADGMSDENRAQAGFLPFAFIQCCDQSQRSAALQAIGRFLPDAAAYGFLWSQATGAGLVHRRMAIRAIADDLPNHASELLSAYRAPYRMRSVGGNPEAFAEDTAPRIVAASALVLGITRCPADLQEEIRNTIRFRYDGPADHEFKYSHHPDCVARNETIAFLAAPFQEDGRGDPALAERVRIAVGGHFLEDFLRAFTDRGSVYVEAVQLAAAWGNETRVVDAFAEYLETWGGTFLSESVTKHLIWIHSHQTDLPVTERFLRAVDLVERKPMDTPWKGMHEDASPPWTHVGEWSAREIRDSIALWRASRAKDIAGLPRP